MKKPLTKALTVANIQNQRVYRVPFEDQFYQAFRQPQKNGVWFIYGPSASGKSDFTMQLSKEYARNTKVLYDLLEEELNDSDFIERTERHQMQDVKSSFHAAKFDYDDLVAYLKKRNSPDTVVIDSARYFFKNFEQYQQFKKMFAKTKTIIITGHAKGQNPRTDLEESIMFDAKQKVFVSAYLALCKGRTIGPNGGQFIVWKEGYEKARGSENKK